MEKQYSFFSLELDEKTVSLETELNDVMVSLGMDPEEHRYFAWLRDLVLLAAVHPDSWQDKYLIKIGLVENVTYERIRQILYKTAWDHWSANSKAVLHNHFGESLEISFAFGKPNHEEFILLLSNALRKKYEL